MLETLAGIHGWLDWAMLSVVGTAVGITAYFQRRHVAISEELSRSRFLFENLAEGVYRALPDGRHIRANTAMARLQGYATSQAVMHASPRPSVECYVDPTRGAQFRELLFRDGTVTDFVSQAYRHRTGERIWISESARLIRSRSGAPLCYEGTVRDVTETMQRLQLEERFTKLTSHLPGGLFQFERKHDGAFDVAYISDGFVALTGLSFERGYPSPHSFFEIVVDKDRPRFMESFHRARKGGRPWEHEFRIRHGETVKWLRVLATPEAVADGIMWHGYVTDISLRKAQEMEIRRLAYRDPLTDLSNRRALIYDTRKALYACRRDETCGALIYVDLDNFKGLNDRHGHEVGDRYLKQVAERLTSVVGDTGTVARIGGDEFVALLPAHADNRPKAAAEALALAQRMAAEMARPFQIGAICHSASASIGIVVFDGSETSVDALLKQADQAMYGVKAAGGNGVGSPDANGLQAVGAQMRERAPGNTSRLSA